MRTAVDKIENFRTFFKCYCCLVYVPKCNRKKNVSHDISLTDGAHMAFKWRNSNPDPEIHQFQKKKKEKSIAQMQKQSEN